MSAADLTKLKLQRGQLKSVLTRAKGYLANLNKDAIDAAVITELKLRFNKIEPLLDKYDELQVEIEILVKSSKEKLEYNEEQEEAERSSFETEYYTMSREMTMLISIHSESRNETQTPQTPSVNEISSLLNQSFVNQSIKLPTISLPKFNADFKTWMEFRDSFDALVHRNSSLSDIQKFYYLKSCLGEKASQIIDSIQVSAQNYTIAWNLLSERFEQKSLIIQSHLSAIFEYPAMAKESHSDLRNLFDTVTKNLRSLQALGQPTDQWDSLIIYILSSKMDTKTRKEWELYEKSSLVPAMDDMNRFLKQRCEVLEKLSINLMSDNKKEKINSHYKHKGSTHSYVASENSDSKGPVCYYCQGFHSIFKCSMFLNASPQDRIAVVKKNKLCYNCLRPSHSIQNCFHSNCTYCGLKHNSYLHIDRNKKTQFENNNKVQQQPFTKKSVHASETKDETEGEIGVTYSHNIFAEQNSFTNSQVLLSTAIVKVKDGQGKNVNCRVLLDSGSMSNFVSESLCKKLNLPLRSINYSVVGVGQSTTAVKFCTNFTISSMYNAYSTEIQCLVLPKITDNLPTISFNKISIKIPNNIKLADPSFSKTGSVDILLGASVFWQLLSIGQIEIDGTSLRLQKTQFGWVIGGCLSSPMQQLKSLSFHSLEKQLDDSILEKSLTKFWELENVNNIKCIRSQEEEFCEKHFIENFKRQQDGRFIVQIPFKGNVESLGQSKDIAKNRFYAQERRLVKNPRLRAEYIKFMNEYEQMGHMSLISEIDNSGYFIPHHPVVRESSLTTKTRIVWDASMKTDSGLSLNNVQHVGPTIQNDLLSIILRFRKHNFVMTADISKMYRMILIDPEQRKYQQIFWRSSPDEHLRCYELNTVSYGTASAPWLAIRSLHQLAIENEQTNPVASNIIKNDFYVDDLLSGSSSRSELIQLQRQISDILSSGGFILRKWLSNDYDLCKQFSVTDNVDVGILSIGDNEANKTLGVLWNPVCDTIQFSVGSFDNQKPITKRSILSLISQIYDPQGLLGPIVVVAKILIQKLWQAKVGWDESVPQNLFTAWIQFCNDLKLVNNIKLPRQVLLPSFKYVELHVFADASERAFGTCIYVRSKDDAGNCLCRLLVAKSRVAPLKQITLPRLELSAALLAVQLTQRVTESMHLTFDNIYYWSDSTITLCWIKASPARWKTFIANRVSEIQRLSDVNMWHHVQSKENPADLISRGVIAEELVNSSLWFTGPDWLNDSTFKIKNCEMKLDDIEIPEQRIVTTFTVTNNFDLVHKFSNLKKLRRVVAYIFRFIFNCSKGHVKKTGVLNCEELENATYNLIRLSQQESFSLEYNQIKNNKPLHKRSNLLTLNPFIDDKGLLRVGGRIQNSVCQYDKRHSIILSSKHVLTKLIMIEEHERLLHCGPTMLLCSVREKYWPIHGRNLAKRVVFNCIKCFKVNPRTTPQYLMGNLPECRTNQFCPFFNTGCDFAGPFTLRDKITKDTRGTKLVKGYVCLFICLATKAVHLEAVTSLSTESFLATFRRFIGRRGRPLHMYSDNALNFVGANIELKRLYQFLEIHSDEINSSLSVEGITWHFAPPRSPNFGGIWEAGIKSAKFHLKRIVGETHLNFEDFSTVLIQIESILNSRPICPLPSTPDQLNPLTPAHFIMGKAATALPERNYIDVPQNRLKRFERLQSIIQHFWSRWSREYLNELQTRSKWKTKANHDVKVGTIVLVKEDNLPPLQWHMGRVTDLHPGNDGIIRVVSVLVNQSVVKRAVSKLCPFPFEHSQSEA